MKFEATKGTYWGTLCLLLLAIAAVHCAPNNGTTTTAQPTVPKGTSANGTTATAPMKMSTAGGVREGKQLDLGDKDKYQTTGNGTSADAHASTTASASAKLEGNMTTTTAQPASGTAGTLSSLGYHALFVVLATFIFL